MHSFAEEPPKSYQNKAAAKRNNNIYPMMDKAAQLENQFDKTLDGAISQIIMAKNAINKSRMAISSPSSEVIDRRSDAASIIYDVRPFQERSDHPRSLSPFTGDRINKIEKLKIAVDKLSRATGVISDTSRNVAALPTSAVTGLRDAASAVQDAAELYEQAQENISEIINTLKEENQENEELKNKIMSDYLNTHPEPPKEGSGWFYWAAYIAEIYKWQKENNGPKTTQDRIEKFGKAASATIDFLEISGPLTIIDVKIADINKQIEIWKKISNEMKYDRQQIKQLYQQLQEVTSNINNGIKHDVIPTGIAAGVGIGVAIVAGIVISDKALNEYGPLSPIYIYPLSQ